MIATCGRRYLRLGRPNRDVIKTFSRKLHLNSTVLSVKRPMSFWCKQFYLAPELVLEKLDLQAATLGQERSFIVQQLRKMVPSFAVWWKRESAGDDKEMARLASAI